MSLFSWFSKKSPVPAIAEVATSNLVHHGASAPFPHSPSDRVKSPASTGSSSSRKSQRMVQRELLYTTVRESMARLGVLSSSYKFKVLSLDSLGREYLVMMDLARLKTGELLRLADIESLIVKSAKLQHEIVVTSVYWRVEEFIASPPVRASGRPLPRTTRG